MVFRYRLIDAHTERIISRRDDPDFHDTNPDNRDPDVHLIVIDDHALAGAATVHGVYPCRSCLERRS